MPGQQKSHRNNVSRRSQQGELFFFFNTFLLGCALSSVAFPSSSAKETGLGPTAPGEIQTTEELRPAPSAAVAGPLLR